MEPVIVEQIEERLRHLPQEKLLVVLDFVSYLQERQEHSDIRESMLIAESSLRKDWDRAEEDAAWADL